MDRMVARLVRRLAGLLTDGRREWVQALVAEADEFPGRTARLAWLCGGLWLVAREVLMNRLLRVLAFAAGAVALVWISWPGAASNSATALNRMWVIGILVLLAVLPLLVRRYVGPVRSGWAPLATRVGGYAVVLALIAAKNTKDRLGGGLGRYLPVILPLWGMQIVLLLVVAGYVAGLLVLTSGRVAFTRGVLPIAAGIGALTACLLYPLAPFGTDAMLEDAMHGGSLTEYLVLGCFAAAALAVPVAVHAAVARLADRDTRPGILAPRRQAVLATTGAMAVAAILVALFTSLTIALLPHRVPRQPAPGGMCPTCEPSTIVIPPSLRDEYTLEASVGAAGQGTFLALLVVPLAGAVIAARRNPAAPH